MPDAVSSSQLRRPETGALAIQPQSQSWHEGCYHATHPPTKWRTFFFPGTAHLFWGFAVCVLGLWMWRAEVRELSFRKALRWVFRALISLCSGQAESGDPVVLNTSPHTSGDLRMQRLEASQWWFDALLILWELLLQVNTCLWTLMIFKTHRNSMLSATVFP